MSASISGTSAMAIAYGMPTGHCYTAVAAYTLTNSTGSYNLIKIRNPWGSDGLDTYTGPWNDLDTSNWTPAN